MALFVCFCLLLLFGEKKLIQSSFLGEILVKRNNVIGTFEYLSTIGKY